MPPTPTIPIETFARDLWEALRDQSREQLGESVTDEVFDTRVPPWEKLSTEVKATKITIAREELLRILDRAGYQVRKKAAPTSQGAIPQK